MAFDHTVKSHLLFKYIYIYLIFEFYGIIDFFKKAWYTISYNSGAVS